VLSEPLRSVTKANGEEVEPLMPHPLLLASRIVGSVVVVIVPIWGAYTLAEIRKALEQLRKP
jgi:hypothetical protein